jgi:hypothetical protein
MEILAVFSCCNKTPELGNFMRKRGLFWQIVWESERSKIRKFRESLMLCHNMEDSGTPYKRGQTGGWDGLAVQHPFLSVTNPVPQD